MVFQVVPFGGSFGGSFGASLGDSMLAQGGTMIAMILNDGCDDGFLEARLIVRDCRTGTMGIVWLVGLVSGRSGFIHAFSVLFPFVAGAVLELLVRD